MSNNSIDYYLHTYLDKQVGYHQVQTIVQCKFLAWQNPKKIWPKPHYALDFNNKIKKTNQNIPQNILMKN
jgi:hypothetical protein